MRWLQFSLRTLLLLMLVCGLGLGYYVNLRPPPLGLDGYCPVTLVQLRKWRRGDPQFHRAHQGRLYLLQGTSELDLFNANPEKFAPVCGGLDVVQLQHHCRSTPGRCTHGLTYRRRIYLFENEDSLQSFLLLPAAYERFALQSESQPARR